ncbi:hypothetical protein CANARDRAFT_26990 [[Candida] arabinofermentans NRRL YB-2248]|uniref:SPS-sensor serine protease component SSY5 n=1 Tax=[Candida] arabinofermentans NRRL YB-2248 TaxID=983967 RepID=A0A1E4T788_9ASCO|nr:hypothetical protein CANARDRAFT_26990 [[Candida] arabinofermentans NRRL YB-2248]
MSVKRIFSKKKKTSNDVQGSSSQLEATEDASSMKSGRSSASSSSLKKDVDLDKFDSKTLKSFQYSFNSNTNSLFSSKHTMSTGASSKPSTTHSYKKQAESQKQDDNTKLFTSIGRPLRVLDEEELEEEEESLTDFKIQIPQISRQSFNRRRSNHSDEAPSIMTERSSSLPNATGAVLAHSTTNSSTMFTASNNNDLILQQLVDYIERQLKLLSTTMSNTLIQVSQSVLNLTKASINISDSLRSTMQTISKKKDLRYLPAFYFNTVSSVGLRKLIKNVLYLIDNLLLNEVYDNSKAMVLKNLYDLLSTLKLIDLNDSNGLELGNYISIMSPSLFPIGSTLKEFPSQSKITKIMESLVAKSKEKLFVDQNGAFIAPVLRGFQSEDLSIITFMFGFPELNKEHHDIIKFFSTTSDDLHFLVQKNSIVLASTAATASANPIPMPSTTKTAATKFKAPFRTIDSNSDCIPISMSLAACNSLNLSGTLGGYIFPKIPADCQNPKLLKYSNSIFGLTCAHVVLNGSTFDENNGGQYPFVSTPSPVLINLYKNALASERLKYNVESEEFRAYDSVIKKIDEIYPIKQIRVKNKKLSRNLPQDTFGQIIWGERIIENDKLSDLAIIKIDTEGNKNKKFLNYLGDDLNLNEYDPSLMFGNLYVKKIISLKPEKNNNSNSTEMLSNHADLEVFKVGSTTNFTNGKLNGLKLIYWSDGSLKTSEFIISSSKKNFASGGDSGSFILSKLSNIKQQERLHQHYNDIQQLQPSSVSSVSGPNAYSGFARSTSKRSILSTLIDNFMPRTILPLSGDRQQQQQQQHQQSQHSQQQGLTNVNTLESDSGAESGLGVVGMLHSYDGEFKQFGLFTPMKDILGRLEDVTGIEWGIVGCDEDDENEDESLGSSDDQFGSSSDDDDDDDSFVDGDAFAPL